MEFMYLHRKVMKELLEIRCRRSYQLSLRSSICGFTNMGIYIKAVRVSIFTQAQYLISSEIARKRGIDHVQKRLPLNYSFVHIQNFLTNLPRDNKFFTVLISKTRLVRLF